MPSKDEFREAIHAIFEERSKVGAESVTIVSGDLHRKVGGYPSRNHSMPSCCSAMYDKQTVGDEILDKPPSGFGASFRIRYRLPRATDF